MYQENNIYSRFYNDTIYQMRKRKAPPHPLQLILGPLEKIPRC